MLANADIRIRFAGSDVELGGLDPLPEIRARRLLQVGGVHACRTWPSVTKSYLFVVGREALHEGLVGDVVLAPGALAAEALDLDRPTIASITSSCDGQLPPFAFIAFSTAAL